MIGEILHLPDDVSEDKSPFAVEIANEPLVVRLVPEIERLIRSDFEQRHDFAGLKVLVPRYLHIAHRVTLSFRNNEGQVDPFPSSE